MNPRTGPSFATRAVLVTALALALALALGLAPAASAKETRPAPKAAPARCQCPPSNTTTGVKTMTVPLFQLDSMYRTRTYGGVLAGAPSERKNQREIESAKATARKLWGDRATFVVPPVIDTSQGYPELPPVLTLLWLTSGQPVRDAEADGAELVVVWFHHHGDLAPSQLLAKLAPLLDWKKQAVDFTL